jgi:hypothetical protein
VLQTALSGAARFDHDPDTLEPLGLLIEEARTNLCLQSGQIGYTSPGPWLIGGGITIALNNIVAPDGTLTGTKDTGTGTGSFVRQLCPVTASTAYTFSFWAKKGTATDIRYAVYDATNAAYIVPNSTNYFSQLNGDEWTRISVKFTTPAGCISVGIYPDNNSSFGAGTSYLWGAQLELGKDATSYIPTTTATATRTGDRAVISGANFTPWYNAPAGTFVVAYMVRIGAPVGRVATFSLSGSGSNTWSGQRSTTGAMLGIVRVVGANFDCAAANTSPAATADKYALAVEAGRNGSCLNGGTVTTNAPTSAPNVDQVDLGSNVVSSQLTGWLSSFKYFNVAKTDAELIDLTTP